LNPAGFVHCLRGAGKLSENIPATNLIQTQSKIAFDAFKFGNHLADEIWEHRTSVEDENRYTGEVTGANMYGYHSQKEIDEFVSIADKQCITKENEYLAQFKKLRAKHAFDYLHRQQGLTEISEGNVYQRAEYAKILNYAPEELKLGTVAALNAAFAAGDNWRPQL
jgi:hypothetical protein